MSQKLTKITEYLYKILLILLIFLNLKTSNMPSNKHPRKMSTSRGSSLNAYQTYSWYKERIKYFFGCTVYLARKCTLNTRQVFWVSKWKYLKQMRYTRVFNNNESDIANLIFGYTQFNRPNYAKLERSQNRLPDLKFRYLAQYCVKIFMQHIKI